MMEAAVEAGFGAELYDADHMLYTALGRDEAATQLWLDWWLAGEGADNDSARSRFLRLLTGHLAGRTDPALADSVAGSWDISHTHEDPNPGWQVIRRAGAPDLAVDLLRRMSSLDVDLEQRANLHFQMALAWAHRGAWDSARVELRRFSDLECQFCGTDGYWLSAMGEWLGGLPSGSADEFRPSMVASIDAWGDECPDCGIWLASVDGVIASGRRDVALLRDALGRVESAVATDARLGQIASYVARSQRAAEMELAGDRSGAADSLYALIQEIQYPPRVPGYGHLHAFNRLSAARWLRAEGDRTGARSVLMELQLPWRQPYDKAIDHHFVSVATGLTYLELAEMEDAGGPAPLARDYYEQFLRRYDMPVEAHRPMVEEARAAYERLGGT
jgi:hypothetical protein